MKTQLIGCCIVVFFAGCASKALRPTWPPHPPVRAGPPSLPLLKSSTP